MAGEESEAVLGKENTNSDGNQDSVNEEVKSVEESSNDKMFKVPPNPQKSDVLANDKLLKLPLSRVKSIMKSDPDVTLASQEAVILLAKAAELFIQMLSKDAVGSTVQGKRKTLQRKDLDHVLDTRDSYLFLEGTLD
ncbi:hypothetical protein CHS0354_008560 [Potamilus streckersoni]|uniref:Transcription factor CBF/NF-Y/archaeal histone domain-containing protein n=1 Tax=Potamilus streckersoni TaxID=2493646 RepID=A0AAE0VJ23_9BIVA|nr:hypothetical protein CHS0354_008560 [Potamilus streckersoni]